MTKVIKQGIAQDVQQSADQQVRTTVEAILHDVQTRGDAAVRDYSAKFDQWSPAAFKLSPTEIEALMATLPAQVIDDIQFAQAQVRNFAQVQRSALRDVE